MLAFLYILCPFNETFVLFVFLVVHVPHYYFVASIHVHMCLCVHSNESGIPAWDMSYSRFVNSRTRTTASLQHQRNKLSNVVVVMCMRRFVYVCVVCVFLCGMCTVCGLHVPVIHLGQLYTCEHFIFSHIRFRILISRVH